MAYPPYVVNGSCSKCGNTKDHKTYYIQTPEGEEFLSRCCGRCGYQWKEAVV